MQNEIRNESTVPDRPKRFNIFKKLKGRNKRETLERYSIAGVIFGALLLSLGIGLTAISPKGMSAIIAMMGALLSFLSSVALVLSWLLQEMFG